MICFSLTPKPIDCINQFESLIFKENVLMLETLATQSNKVRKHNFYLVDQDGIVALCISQLREGSPLSGFNNLILQE